MSATDNFENSLLSLLFTNIAITGIGDVGGLLPSAAAGSFYISLHTSTLADTDSSQAANEADYTSYARVGVPRDIANWTVAGGNVDNDNPITFPKSTGGSNTITDFGIGSALSGVGALLIYGTLDSSIAVSNGITPQFASGELDISVN